jgi:hypothetical protein
MIAAVNSFVIMKASEVALQGIHSFIHSSIHPDDQYSLI